MVHPVFLLARFFPFPLLSMNSVPDKQCNKLLLPSLLLIMVNDTDLSTRSTTISVPEQIPYNSYALFSSLNLASPSAPLRSYQAETN